MLVVNCLHSMSLKEGVVRKGKMAPVLTAVLTNLLTKKRFFDNLESKRLTQLFSALTKFHSNVKEIDRPFFQALLNSLLHLSDFYRQATL